MILNTYRLQRVSGDEFFRLSSAVRIDDHKSAAKLLCPPQLDTIENESTVAENF